MYEKYDCIYVLNTERGWNKASSTSQNAAMRNHAAPLLTYSNQNTELKSQDISTPEHQRTGEREREYALQFLRDVKSGMQTHEQDQ